MAAPVEVRFWSKVDPSGPCWLWRGALDADGYGRFGYSPQLRSVMAHRVAYELLVGPIPAGLTLDHVCRIRRCVNPAHLRPMTAEANSSLQVHPKSLWTHCVNGHPFDEENTAYRRNGNRTCRACNRDAVRRYREKRLA